MNNLSRVGIDLAKNIYQLHGVNRTETSTWCRRLKRDNWVIREPGWLEIADYVSEWLISSTTSSTPDVHGSTNVAVIWISKTPTWM